MFFMKKLDGPIQKGHSNLFLTIKIQSQPIEPSSIPLTPYPKTMHLVGIMYKTIETLLV